MKKFLLSASIFSCVACGDGQVTMTINTIGDPAALTATNGVDVSIIALDEGFLVYRNINLVSNDLVDEVPLVGPGETLDFVANASFNIAPVEVPKVDYQQIRLGLDNTAAVAFHAKGTIDINGGGPIPFEIDYKLPAEDENVFDNAIAFGGNEAVDSFSLDLEKLFSNIDFVTIEDDQNGDVIINETTALADVSVQVAIDAYTTFFSEANADTMYTDQ